MFNGKLHELLLDLINKDVNEMKYTKCIENVCMIYCKHCFYILFSI